MPSFRRLSPIPVARVWLLGALCLGALGPVAAERADRDKPMNIEADALRYDDARQLSIFTGNVVITRGTLVLRGTRVEIRQDAQGRTSGVVFGAERGTPAFFRQKREGLDEWMEGEGQRIEYDGESELARLTGQAVLRRYRGATLSDETHGHLITYNNLTDVFTVDSGGSATAGQAPGRVRAMITPAPREGEAAGASVPTEPARLSPSPRLGGGRP